MNSQAWAREMARYNKWQNETLYGICDGLNDDDRKADRGMFFGSIHRTLDHILMVDHVLRGFVVDGFPPDHVFDPNKKLYDDYEDLKTARMAFDGDMLDLIERNSDDWLDGTISFTSERLNRTRTMPRKFYCMQMFNHATHHRSQVTSELHKMGIDYGNTDLPYNPLSQF